MPRTAINYTSGTVKKRRGGNNPQTTPPRPRRQPLFARQTSPPSTLYHLPESGAIEPGKPRLKAKWVEGEAQRENEERRKWVEFDYSWAKKHFQSWRLEDEEGRSRDTARERIEAFARGDGPGRNGAPVMNKVVNGGADKPRPWYLVVDPVVPMNIVPTSEPGLSPRSILAHADLAALSSVHRTTTPDPEVTALE